MTNHRSNPHSPLMLCPCGSHERFELCCQPRHTGQLPAETAEQLMRSRYTAFVVGAMDYLAKTWHTSTCPPDLAHDESIKWCKLEIVATQNGRATDQDGIVEFIAHYKIGGRAGRLHEISRFCRNDAHQWCYLDGTFPERS